MDSSKIKACVLASGSKGNCTFVASKKTKLLIDLGISALNVEKKLDEINVDVKKIHAILITHTHIDHIKGLRVFIKKYNPKIYLSEIMYQELSKLFEIKNYEIVEEEIVIGDIKVEAIKTSHDTDDSNGYILSCDKSSLVYITDTGYINKKYHSRLTNKNMYILESNHDVEMLMNGRYPYHLKQRVVGDRGHLSNKDCAYYLKKMVGENTKTIVLAHLSEENNLEELAYDTTYKKISNENIKVIVAKQNKRTDLMEV